MESFVHLRKGITPRRVHADVGDLKDDEIGRGGFTGRTAHLYRRHDPTRYRTVGALRPLDVMSSDLKPTDSTDADGAPLLLFSNSDCRVSLSRRTEAMPFYARYIDGDLLAFVHRGAGLLETEFGPLRYREGDWVYLPKATTFRQVPDEESTMLIIEATEEFRVPPAGTLGRHFPFDPAQIVIPEAQAHDDDGRSEYEVRLYHQGGPSSQFRPHHPLDVEGWRGDNFAFTFNIADYNPIGSPSVHLPPTVHLFMQATGVYVMNFLPRPAESAPGTETIPWYHRNVDYDELAFVHGGDLYGISLREGMISHAPQGIHHGAPEKLREIARARRDTVTDIGWSMISIDTRRRLTPSAELLAHSADGS